MLECKARTHCIYVLNANGRADFGSPRGERLRPFHNCTKAVPEVAVLPDEVRLMRSFHTPTFGS